MRTFKLGEVCKIVNGGTPKTGTEEYWNGDISWITPKDLGRVRTRETSHTQRKITQNGAENSSAKVIPVNSVILSTRAPIGHVVINSIPMAFNQGCRGLVPSDEITAEFLYYFLKFSKSYLDELGTGTTFRELSTTALSNVEIPLPSIDEQRRIVARLDAAFEKVDRAIELTRKNSNNVKEFYDTSLASAFDNNIEIQSQSLENIGIITSSKRIYKSEYEKSGVPFYRTKEVKELANSKSVSTELYISKERYHLIRDQFGVPSPGDLLVTAIGTIGEIYVVRDKKEFYFKDGNVLWLKDFKSIDSFFLKYALQRFVTELNSLSYGSAYNALPIQKLKKYVVPVPPIEKQLEVVKKLDTVSLQTQKLQQLYRIKLQSLESLKQSLLTQAFSQDKVQ